LVTGVQTCALPISAVVLQHSDAESALAEARAGQARRAEAGFGDGELRWPTRLDPHARDPFPDLFVEIASNAAEGVEAATHLDMSREFGRHRDEIFSREEERLRKDNAGDALSGLGAVVFHNSFAKRLAAHDPVVEAKRIPREPHRKQRCPGKEAAAHKEVVRRVELE